MEEKEKKFDFQLSEIEGQGKINHYRMGNGIPDNTTEKSGTGWYPESDEENIKNGESL